MAEKKNVKLTVNRQELMYGIMNETYLRGRTIQNDQNFKEVASMFASEDEENYEKILRSIQEGVANLKVQLGEYLSETDLTSDSSIKDEDSDIVINLTLPSNFNPAAAAGLAESANSYLQNKAIADWYQVTNAADAAKYLELMGTGLNNLLLSVSKRSRPTRPDRKAVTATPDDGEAKDGAEGKEQSEQTPAEQSEG